MAEKLSGGSRGKPIRCRAAVCRKPTEPMPHEVRVRIIYTSLCHSDLTFWKMKETLEAEIKMLRKKLTFKATLMPNADPLFNISR